MENNIAEAYKDIIGLKISREDKISDIMDQFYEILRKHNIKQGTPSLNEEGEKVGTICNTPEWSICFQALKVQLDFFFTFENLLEAPEDLKCYEV